MKDKSEEKNLNLITITDIIKKFKYQLMFLISLCIINELSQILSPYLMSLQYASIEKYYNNIISLKEVYYINIKNTAFWSISIIFSALCKIIFTRFLTNIEAYVKINIFRFLHNISYEDFLQIQGEKAFNYLKNLEYNIKEIFSTLIIHIFSNLWTILMNICILFYVVPNMGYVVIIWLLLHFIFLKITLYFTKDIGEQVYTVKKDISNSILESFLHILMIKVNNIKNYEEDNLQKEINKYEVLMKKYSFNTEFCQMFSHLISEILIWGLGIYVLLYSLVINPLPISTIFYLVMVMYGLVNKVRNISINISRFLENIKEYQINRNFLLQYKIPKYKNKIVHTNSEENNKSIISLIDVSFSMNNKKILHNVSIDIKEGEKVCFIGPSGSGKSTLINLFTGIYKKYDGIIKIYNQDTYNISEDEIIDNFSIINQSPMLFNRTVIENLTQGKNIDEQKIEYYCKLVQIHDFINSLPNGYNTIIHGKNISGGQAQRLCLARMLLREKPIYIFDEATNGLDQKTKTMFLSSIFDLIHQQNKNIKDTIIFIDHSLAFLHKVDRIVMLEDGHIIFDGKYEEILKFHKFINLQNHKL